jgi:hypothetical protein
MIIAANEDLPEDIGATVPVHSIKTCVVYDAASGRIHHSHSVLTLVGGREPPEDEIGQDAVRTLRSRRNPPAGELHVLHVPHESLDPNQRYRVDHAKRIVVPVRKATN